MGLNPYILRIIELKALMFGVFFGTLTSSHRMAILSMQNKLTELQQLTNHADKATIYNRLPT